MPKTPPIFPSAVGLRSLSPEFSRRPPAALGETLPAATGAETAPPATLVHPGRCHGLTAYVKSA